MATPSAMDDASIFPFAGEHGTSMSYLLEEGKYSDLTIECGEDTHAVHKAIVCTRSPFFAACCDGKFKEAKSGVIKLPDDDPVAVKMMIQYLYTGTYPAPSKGANNAVAPPQTSTSFFGPSSSATSTFAPKRESSANPPVASTPVASASTAQPHASAIPPAPSTPGGNIFGAGPPVSVNPPAPAVPATNIFPAQAQPSVNSPAVSTPGADLFSTHPQYFNGGSQRGRGNSRNRRGGRNSGNQRGNHTPNSYHQPVPATPAPVQAQAPVPTPTTTPASVQSGAFGGFGFGQAAAPISVPAPTPAPVPATPTPVPQRKPEFVLHAKIYALGEKYEIKDLKALALQKFGFEATLYWSYTSFRYGAKEAYTSTVDEDRGMRNIVVETVLKHRYLLSMPEFQKVLKETDLGFDLLMRLKLAEITPGFKVQD